MPKRQQNQYRSKEVISGICLACIYLIIGNFVVAKPLICAVVPSGTAGSGKVSSASSLTVGKLSARTLVKSLSADKATKTTQKKYDEHALTSREPAAVSKSVSTSNVKKHGGSTAAKTRTDAAGAAGAEKELGTKDTRTAVTSSAKVVTVSSV